MIAESYIMFGDLKSAIHTLNTMKLACNLSNMKKNKIICLKLLANICKKLNQFIFAKKFLKRAL